MKNLVLWVVLILFIFSAASVPVLAFRKGNWKPIIVILLLFGAVAALLLKAVQSL